MSYTPLFAKGTQFTCENGHPIATAARDLYIGQRPEPGMFESVPKQAPIHKGNPIMPCTICGERWLLMAGFSGVRLHTEDGWRPRLNEP